MDYKIIDSLTSDVAFEAYGNNLKELFENSAKALLSIICDVSKIEKKKKVEFSFYGEDIKEALYDFLSNIIAEIEINELFFSQVKILNIKENGEISGSAVAYGEDISKDKGKTVVKAITYHNFHIKKNKIFKAIITCDI